MSVDPVSIGIKVAVYAATTAITASQVIEGPRLKDLGVAVSEYGTPLVDVYGECKIDGLPYIHAEKLREKKVQSKTKGGKYNNYKYFFTGAAAVCGHELDAISRVWFDGRLVYDATNAGPTSILLGLFQGLGGDTPVKLARGRNFRMQLGTEAQLPDPRYEEWCEDRYGPDSANAWRGTPYLFFEEIPLEKLGNRPPTISALAVRNKTDAFLSTTLDGNTAPQFTPDFMRFAMSGAMWDTATHSKIVNHNFDIHAFGSDGTLWNLSGNFPVGPTITAYSFDGVFSTPGPTSTVGADEVILIPGTGNAGDLIFLRPYGAVLNQMIQRNGPAFIVTSLDFSPTFGLRDASGEAYLLGRKFGGANGISVLGLTGFREGAAAPVIPTSGTEPVDEGWLNADGDWVLIQGNTVYRIDTENLTVIQSASGPFASTNVSAGPGGVAFWTVSGSTATEYSMLDLSVIRTVDLTAWGGTGVGGVYDPINHAIAQTTAGNTRLLYLDRVANAGMSLSSILEIECGLVNVSDIVFSGTDPTISGWAVAPGKVTDRISPLLDIHDADAGPHDFGIRFLVRGSSAGTAIDSSEFVKDGEIRWQAPQTQDVQLPMRLTFTYADGSKDHKINSSVFQRPGSVTDSNQDQKIDMSTYVSTPVESQPLVDRFGRRKWFEHEQIEFSLTLRHAALEPGDVRSIVLDGEPRIGRLIDLTRSGLMLKTKWVRDDPRVHDTNAAVGPSLDGRDDDELYISGPTKAYVLDIPLLTDSENTTNVLLHYGSGPYSLLHDWPGATIFQLDSVENEYGAWEDVESSQRGNWGYAAEALPGANPWIWDERNSLNIYHKGTLVSRTKAEIDAEPSLNLAYLGGEAGDGELLNFADATLEVDGSWTISTLKRGRRGTEWAVDDHATGDLFVVANTLLTDMLGIDEIGGELTFKGQSFGRTLDGAPAFTVPIEARNLKPYAPAHFTAVKDVSTGDWNFTWVRRTRVGGNWRGGSTIPLGETSENYKLNIYDGGTAVRTITSTIESATWTSAQQTTDFGGAQSSVVAGVLQVADAVDGFEVIIERGAAPSVRAAGTFGETNAAGASISPGIPTGTEAGDILLLVCETDGSDTIAAPSGWESVANSPQAGTNSKLHLFWRRAGYSESAPTVVRTGDHLMGKMIGIRGGLPRGNPFDATAGGTGTGTAQSIPGLTTSVDNCLVLDFITSGIDTNAAQHSGWTNASLASITEEFDSQSDAGGGGGVACAAGVKVTAGAVSATSVTQGSAENVGFVKVALRPE